MEGRGGGRYETEMTWYSAISPDCVLYVMSDCYLGLDQQFSLPLLVEPAGEEIFYSDLLFCCSDLFIRVG